MKSLEEILQARIAELQPYCDEIKQIEEFLHRRKCLAEKANGIYSNLITPPFYQKPQAEQPQQQPTQLVCNHCHKTNQIECWQEKSAGFITVYCQYCGKEIDTLIDTTKQEKTAPPPVASAPAKASRKYTRPGWGKSDEEKKRIVLAIAARLAKGEGLHAACTAEGTSDASYYTWKKFLKVQIPAPMADEPEDITHRWVPAPEVEEQKEEQQTIRTYKTVDEDAPREPWNKKEAGVEYLKI